jgi:hypothetical protein
MGLTDNDLYNFSEEEVIEIRKNFPKLSLKSRGVLDGDIDIDAIYNEYRIEDTFKIGIIVPSKPNEFPCMLEIGGRTDNIAKKHNLTDKRDLHYNPKTGLACLCVKQEETKRFPPGSKIADFIENLVIPYLYGLSYFDKEGEWPWEEYSHGCLGLLEFYAEDSNGLTQKDIEDIAFYFKADPNWKKYSKQIRNPSAKRACICGSKKQFKDCHPKAWQGIIRLNREIEKLGLNSYKIYRR